MLVLIPRYRRVFVTTGRQRARGKARRHCQSAPSPPLELLAPLGVGLSTLWTAWLAPASARAGDLLDDTAKLAVHCAPSSRYTREQPYIGCNVPRSSQHCPRVIFVPS